jgi:hypothetical protein
MTVRDGKCFLVKSPPPTAGVNMLRMTKGEKDEKAKRGSGKTGIEDGER